MAVCHSEAKREEREHGSRYLVPAGPGRAADLKHVRLAVEEQRVIVDGDLLLEFLGLPAAVQAEITGEVANRLGRAVHPQAVEVLLRDIFDDAPGDE